MKCRPVRQAGAWTNQGTRAIPHPISSPVGHASRNTELTACDQSRSGRSECEEPRCELCQIAQPSPSAGSQSERGFLRNRLSTKEIVAKSSPETVGLRHITCITTTVGSAGITRAGRDVYQSPGFFRSSCEGAFQLIHCCGFARHESNCAPPRLNRRRSPQQRWREGSCQPVIGARAKGAEK